MSNYTDDHTPHGHGSLHRLIEWQIWLTSVYYYLHHMWCAIGTNDGVLWHRWVIVSVSHYIVAVSCIVFFFLFVHFLRSFIVFIDAKRERCAPRHELIGQAFYIHFHFMFVCVLCFLANGSHSGRSWSVTIPWLAKFLRCWWSSKCAPLCDTWSVPRARRWCNWVARNFAIKCEYHIHMSTNHNNTHSIEAIGGT